MDFLQFKEELQETLSVYVKEQLNGTLQVETVLKNSAKSGLVYIPENGVLGMTFYAEDAYEFYRNGASINEIAEKIVETIKEYSEELEIKINVDELLKPENIIPELIPTVGNEEFLKMVPHIPLEDLQIIFKFALPELCVEAKVDVPIGYMEQKGWDEKKLLEIARNNSIYKDDIRLIPLNTLTSIMPDVLEKSMKDDLGFLNELSDKRVIVTNSSKFRGAASILDKDVMATVAAAFDDDLYVIPSSVNECILVSKEQEILEELQEIMYELNRETLPPEERLSDEIYFFDRITKEITMASGQKEKNERQEPKVTEPQRDIKL